MLLIYFSFRSSNSAFGPLCAHLRHQLMPVTLLVRISEGGAAHFGQRSFNSGSFMFHLLPSSILLISSISSTRASRRSAMITWTVSLSTSVICVGLPPSILSMSWQSEPRFVWYFILSPFYLPGLSPRPCCVKALANFCSACCLNLRANTSVCMTDTQPTISDALHTIHIFGGGRSRNNGCRGVLHGFCFVDLATPLSYTTIAFPLFTSFHPEPYPAIEGTSRHAFRLPGICFGLASPVSPSVSALSVLVSP